MFEIKPKTRKEIYMAYLAGDMSLELPEPLTRDEVTLYNLCQSHAYGTTTTVKEVLAECQPEFVADIGGFMLAGNFPIVAGETYIVNWNGKDYPCVSALSSGDSSSGEIGFGNASAAGGEDSGEPFFVDYQYSDRTENNGLAIIPLDGSTTLTISIRQEVTTVQKMSGKYVEGMGYDNSIVIYNKEKSDGDVTDSSGVFVKISDTVIPFDMLDKVVVLFSDGMEVTPYWIEKNSEIAFSESVVVVYAAGASFDFDKFGKFTFPETGAYAAPITEGMLNAIKFTAEDIHPIDSKYVSKTEFYIMSDYSQGSKQIKLWDRGGRDNGARITRAEALAAGDNVCISTIRYSTNEIGYTVYPIYKKDTGDYVEFGFFNDDGGFNACVTEGFPEGPV